MNFASNQLNNVGTYTVSGVVASAKFAVYDNGVLVASRVSTASGVMSNIVVTLDAPHTIRVEGPVQGTIITIR